MATVKEQNENNSAQANLLRNELQNQLAAAGLDSDLIAVKVPVAFAVVVQANPGSALTDEELRDLAAANNFTLYEP